jgi:hypothetical protein
MSTYEEAIEIAQPATEAAPAASRWHQVGDWLERAGEWLNPLLVKECRQALKSRQFALTFTLVLILCWICSLFGVAWFGPSVSFGAVGAEMFFLYYIILAFALLIVVPYSAFRSLAAEHEDNTFELVAITSLKPRQIAGGKLGSAFVQILVYLSAAAPCLAFTYLLRGIDVLTICFVLFYTVLASLGLSMITLLLATVSKEKHWQIVASVFIVIGLFSNYIGVLVILAEAEMFRRDPIPFHDGMFWLVNLMFLSFYWSTFAILYLAAGARLTFTAENRSTSLRIAMLVQQLLLAGWMTLIMFVEVRGRTPSPREILEISVVYFGISAAYWYGMGIFMTAESSDLSPRVQRGLPKSFLGRVLFTWFNPGPGSGYMFAVGNTLAAGLLAMVGVAWATQGPWPGGGIPPARVLWFASNFFLLALGYVVFYLGIGNLLTRLLRFVLNVTIVNVVLLNVLLVIAGCGIPELIRLSFDYHEHGYTLLHVTNPFWTLETVERSSGGGLAGAAILLVLTGAAIVFLLNLLYAVPEVRLVRIAKPQRIVEEDELLAPSKTMPAQPSSPFDD